MISSPVRLPQKKRAPRDAQSGAARPVGFLVTALTAVVVFAVGQRLLSHHEVPAPPSATAPAPTPPPASPPSTSTIADAAAAAPADGARGADAAPVDGARGARDADAAPLDRAPVPIADSGARPAPAARKSTDAEREPDKDLAREAWRRNLPDVSTDGNKAAILIPIKGSIAGAGFRVTNRPHAVIVTLPKAASLITMRVYRVGRDGFRLLWIDQAEKDADPEDGTSLKLGLADQVDPLVEIKDDFVRVTVRRPVPGAAPADRPHARSAPPDAAAD
jgi:hypothetical protein